MEVAAEARCKSTSTNAGKDIVKRICGGPLLEYLCCKSSLSFDNVDIVECVDEDCVGLLAIL